MRDGGKAARRGRRRGGEVMESESERQGFIVKETNVRGDGRWEGGGMVKWEKRLKEGAARRE